MNTIPGLGVTEMNMLVWYLSQISAYLALNNSARNGDFYFEGIVLLNNLPMI